MQSRKVRLEDAYLNGQVGFKDYLRGCEGRLKDDFFKILLKSYNKISPSDIAVEEIMFYSTGFFDDLAKEEERRKKEGLEPLKIEEEDWIQELMEKNRVDSIDQLGAAIVADLMISIEEVYVDSGEMKRYLANRLEKTSDHVSKKYDEYLNRDWVKIEVKDRNKR